MSTEGHDSAADVVEALLAQWGRIAERIPELDLDAPTRLPGWRNREVLAHLTMHAVQAERYLAGPAPARPSMGLADHLLGTAPFAGIVDRTAREAAALGRIDLGAALGAVQHSFREADPERIVITVLGSVRLRDYTVTRCLEAVVHGLDLVPSVSPDPVAERITVEALEDLLRRRRPGVQRPADATDWIEIACGRGKTPAELTGVCPLIG